MAFLLPYVVHSYYPTLGEAHLTGMTIEYRHYYRRRFNPELNLEDIQVAKAHIEPVINRLREVDSSLRAIISRVSRNYSIPIPGAGLGLSTITSPTSPTGDMTRDSARLLLLYLRTVLSKGYFREVDRTWTKVDKFERSYWDEDEGEQNNTGFWKRLEMGDEEIEEGITYVKKWQDEKAREREWIPKIKEMEDAIREGTRWENDVAMRRSSIGSNPSLNGSEKGDREPPLRSFRMSLINAKPSTATARSSFVGSTSSGASSTGSVVHEDEGEACRERRERRDHYETELAQKREKWRRDIEMRRNAGKVVHAQ